MFHLLNQGVCILTLKHQSICTNTRLFAPLKQCSWPHQLRRAVKIISLCKSGALRPKVATSALVLNRRVSAIEAEQHHDRANDRGMSANAAHTAYRTFVLA